MQQKFLAFDGDELDGCVGGGGRAQWAQRISGGSGD
jgi:hypothetical protein